MARTLTTWVLWLVIVTTGCAAPHAGRGPQRSRANAEIAFWVVAGVVAAIVVGGIYYGASRSAPVRR